ncbi:hypothetical protein [Geothrix sp. 21YS21S-2]|uniref:hypothetical protein n=1 Tax=Geothrix sp. 21YS21S-2 TaxID=3068893 RepID=UPI0027B8A835|nr:hypothetical protein [Geothrix sp. 21YS21S-2]
MTGTDHQTISSTCRIHWPLVRHLSVHSSSHGTERDPEDDGSYGLLMAELALAAFAAQEPKGPRQALGWQVEVVDLLPSWMWGGGWADGPFTHHSGARLYLDYILGERVYYQGDQRKGILGWFRQEHLDKIRRLAGPQQPEEDLKH